MCFPPMDAQVQIRTWGCVQNELIRRPKLKTRWAVLIIAVVVGCAASAFASGPQIGIGDPNCNSWNSSLGPLLYVNSSNQFSVQANSIGGGFFGICNQSGSLWTTIDIRYIGDLSGVTCTSTVFNSCVIDTTTFAGITDILFSNPKNGSNGDSGGIPDNQLMTVNLDSNCTPTSTNNCNNNDGDWPGGQVLYGGANGPANIPTPEPATAILLTSGSAALMYYRRRRK